MLDTIANDYLCYARPLGDGWKAHCVELDIVTTGRSLAEAQRRLVAAIERYVESQSDCDDPNGPVPALQPYVWTVQHPTL